MICADCELTVWFLSSENHLYQLDLDPTVALDHLQELFARGENRGLFSSNCAQLPAFSATGDWGEFSEKVTEFYERAQQLIGQFA